MDSRPWTRATSQVASQAELTNRGVRVIGRLPSTGPAARHRRPDTPLASPNLCWQRSPLAPSRRTPVAARLSVSESTRRCFCGGPGGPWDISAGLVYTKAGRNISVQRQQRPDLDRLAGCHVSTATLAEKPGRLGGATMADSASMAEILVTFARKPATAPRKPTI
jgi:hypothetical protein